MTAASLLHTGGWNLIEPYDGSGWIQADLGARHVVYEVVTQGCARYGNWLRTYIIKHSYDGTTWQDIATEFTANFDKHTKVTNQLPANTVCRFIRLYPRQYRTHPTVRWDVRGGKKIKYAAYCYTVFLHNCSLL